MDDKTAFVAGFFAMFALCWYGGADFSERNFGNAILIAMCLLMGVEAVLMKKLYQGDP